MTNSSVSVVPLPLTGGGCLLCKPLGAQSSRVLYLSAFIGHRTKHLGPGPLIPQSRHTAAWAIPRPLSPEGLHLSTHTSWGDGYWSVTVWFCGF